MAQKVSRFLGCYCTKNCHQDLSKLAQSGHTDYDLPIVFQKWANLGLFFVLFSVFSNKHNYIFTTDQREKMSCPSSIWRRDSNPRPLEREPPPITTRPVFPPRFI